MTTNKPSMTTVITSSWPTTLKRGLLSLQHVTPSGRGVLWDPEHYISAGLFATSLHTGYVKLKLRWHEKGNACRTADRLSLQFIIEYTKRGWNVQRELCTLRYLPLSRFLVRVCEQFQDLDRLAGRHIHLFA